MNTCWENNKHSSSDIFLALYVLCFYLAFKWKMLVLISSCTSKLEVGIELKGGGGASQGPRPSILRIFSDTRTRGAFVHFVNILMFVICSLALLPYLTISKKVLVLCVRLWVCPMILSVICLHLLPPDNLLQDVWKGWNQLKWMTLHEPNYTSTFVNYPIFSKHLRVHILFICLDLELLFFERSRQIPGSIQVQCRGLPAE